jgi:hypothetical protein
VNKWIKEVDREDLRRAAAGTEAFYGLYVVGPTFTVRRQTTFPRDKNPEIEMQG